MAAEHILDLPDGTTLHRLYFPGAVEVGDRVRIDGLDYEVEQSLALVAGSGPPVVRAKLRRRTVVSEREDE